MHLFSIFVLRLTLTFFATFSIIGLNTANGAELLYAAFRSDYDGKGLQMFCEVITKGSGSSPIAVRAVGPSLTPYTDPSNILPDPELRLRTFYAGASSETIVGTNYRWGDRDNNGLYDGNQFLSHYLEAFAAAGFVDLEDELSSDAAWLVDAQVGSVSLDLHAPDYAKPKEILLEVASIDSDRDLDIAAIRFRKKVYNNSPSTGVSFTISGEGSQLVLIKTLSGTDLSPYVGTLPVLTDPIIGLYKGDNQIAYNDNWEDQPNSASIKITVDRVGDLPINYGSKDAAILMNLSPGSYTVKLWGGLIGTQTDGDAVVSVYLVDRF